jgi:prolyl oligopeptidase
MGAMITQRPDLFRAVVCQVPLLDMLRYQNFQIAKLWIPEYGTAENAEQFKWLYAYSPYQHVKAGVKYPAVLFTTADSDSRVDPMHAKKMAALMQASAANGSSRDRPILLRIETKAGHGQGKPITKQIEEGTDVWSFLFWQLGVK